MRKPIFVPRSLRLTAILVRRLVSGLINKWEQIALCFFSLGFASALVAALDGNFLRSLPFRFIFPVSFVRIVPGTVHFPVPFLPIAPGSVHFPVQSGTFVKPREQAANVREGRNSVERVN